MSAAASGKPLQTIDLVYFNAGGGHRAAAKALETVLRDQARPWRVRLINLFEVLDPKNLFKKTTGLEPEDVYNKRLAHGWTFGLSQELKLLQALIRMSHRTLTTRLMRHWRQTRPDMVVSLVPNFNRPMYEALGIARPGVPYVTILTDLADHPPHFWIESNQAQHFICGTPKAMAQAFSTAHEQSVIHQTSGMIIQPHFYRERDVDRAKEMSNLGLDAGRPTGIVLFGGHGSKAMSAISERLHDTQLILICGHNASLAARLRASTGRAPRHVVGFTTDVPRYMALSDFFIGKPGPGSISEAIQQRLPVIVVDNAYTMPQERYTTTWITENGTGVVLTSFKAVRHGVAEVIGRLAEFRRDIDQICNRAVFEIPEIFAHILNARSSGSALTEPCASARSRRSTPASGTGNSTAS